MSLLRVYHITSIFFHLLVQFSIFPGHTDSKSFLSHVLSRAQLATRLHSSGQSQRTWHTCVTDLQRVVELNKKLSALANCTATFLQCQLLLSKVYTLQIMSKVQFFLKAFGVRYMYQYASLVPRSIPVLHTEKVEKIGSRLTSIAEFYRNIMAAAKGVYSNCSISVCVLFPFV